MDPNQDGFVSATPLGFSNDGYNVDEFEIPMFGIPIYSDGEVLNDNQVGPKCGTTDITVDSKGYGAYVVKDDGGNVIFRFRIADDRPSVEAYTILLDTDGKVGSGDPNSTPENPGFEVDITLIKNQSKGVYVFDIDGIETCPSPLRFYPYESHFQISIADVVSCGNPDYFYDFYVPVADLQAAFGISDITEVRLVAVTNVSATCAMKGKISDVGGVDDTQYGGCNACAFLDLATNQCPTSLSNLCKVCEGFKFGFTPKPDINTPLKAGELSISGTAVPLANIFIDVFAAAGTLKDRDTVSASAAGHWLATLSLPLAVDDSVTARAQSPGKCRSGISASDLSFAIVEVNLPPQLSATTTPLAYVENDGAVAILPDLVAADPDDVNLDAAVVSVIENFISTEDKLVFVNQNGITGMYNPATGVLVLTGQSSVANYQAALRSIAFENTSEDPATAIRKVRFTVNDGLVNSSALDRTITVSKVNDPPVVSGTASPVLFPDADVVIDNTVVATDVDNTQLTGATVSVSNNLVAAQDVLVFTNQAGITGSYNAGTGVLTLTGTATLAAYQAGFRSIQYRNTSGIPTKLTRRISFVASDGTDSSLPYHQFVVFSGANDPPVIVDNNNFAADSIFFTTPEDVPLEACLNAVDPDGDPVVLSSATSVTNHGNTTLTGGLCFTFQPAANYFGQEILTSVVCDKGSPSLCDTAVVVITITPVNDAPSITPSIVTVPEKTTTAVCVTVTDVEGDPIAYTSGTGTGQSTIGNGASNTDLCFDYTPQPGFLGSEPVTVTVCDQNDPNICTSGVITVKVIDINEPPDTFVNGLPSDTLRVSVPEDSTVVFCFESVDPDSDDVVLQGYAKQSGEGSLSPYENIEFCFTYTPPANYNGQSVWQVNICDDGSPALCSTLVAIIDVLPVNDPPAVVPDSVTVTENSTTQVCIAVTDVEDDPAAFTRGVPSGNGTVTNGSDVTDLCFDYTPPAGFLGDEVITVTVCDEADPAVCNTGTVVITVIEANEPPVPHFNGIPTDTLRLSMPEDSILVFCFEAVDPEGDDVVFQNLANLEGGGELVPSSTGEFCFRYMPPLNFNGQATWRITICDNAVPSLCGALVAIIEVTPVNDPPVAVRDTATVIRNSTRSFNVLSNDSDPEGDGLVLQTEVVQEALHGTAQLLADGTVTYQSDKTYQGIDSLVYRVCDTGTPSLCAEASLVVEVQNLPIKVYEAVSPNGDGLNDYWRIESIDFYAGNLVRVFDRYNNLVFEMSGYDNDQRVWRGQSNHGLSQRDLPEDTYFYTIYIGEEFPEPLSGFVVLKK
jgi:gliding motility-associated-like protein